MLDLNQENFAQEVLAAAEPVLVDFWSPHCDPCLEFQPELAALAEKYAGQAKFCRLNAKAEKRLAIKQGVMGLPFVAFYQVGQQVACYDKEQLSLAVLEAKLRELLA